jgi:oxygen tolerance protein BatD
MMRAALAIGILFGALSPAMGASEARAQTSATIVSATITPTTATVGDRLTLTIVVDHDPTIGVEGPGFGGDFGGLEVVDIPAPASEAQGDRQRTTLTYTLTAFRPGEVLVPPLPITLRSGGVETLQTSPLRVVIASVLEPGDTTLRPLKPQLNLGEDAPTPLLPAIIVAAFAALTALGYVLFRRAAAIRPVPLLVAAATPPIVAPHDAARAELDEIDAARLAESDVREFYARIAMVVRQYLSERFAFPAYAMTRREMDREMLRAGIDRWAARVTGNLLEQCDAAEFAKFVPARERRAADLDAAYEIVDITTPAPDDPAATTVSDA